MVAAVFPCPQAVNSNAAAMAMALPQHLFFMDPVRFWCVPLDGILECYEEITGREPYVY